MTDKQDSPNQLCYLHKVCDFTECSPHKYIQDMHVDVLSFLPISLDNASIDD